MVPAGAGCRGKAGGCLLNASALAYRNPGRWRAVVFRQEVRHGTAGCLLSLVLLAPLLVREWGLTPVVVGIVFYSSVVVPALTGYFSFTKLLFRIYRTTVVFLLSLPASANGHARLSEWAASVGGWAVRVARGAMVGVRFMLVGLVRACVVLPLTLGVGVALVFHHTYMTLHGARITASQELVTPWAHLTSLYFVLFYTVLLYIYRALFGRPVTWLGTECGKWRPVGKGWAISFGVGLFTFQCSSYRPNLTFIAVTFPYFMLTQHRWSGEEGIVRWIRALRLPLLEEEEAFWVPLGAHTLPIAASLVVGVMVVPVRPWLVFVAAYTNLIVPGLLMARKVAGRDSPHAAVITTCRRATPEELEEHPTCPVCLEELRQARVTPCLHLYHAACLASCLAHSSLCPLCKQPI
ncbi:RING finger protein 145 [Chionoecetes opilio]|uniref:RING finger protein 145 n=1 Tax=Chionoecetes opilio TaxID=41210 RepID=A0A8J4YQ08_CHIOP|nr:RING finger protein 145 [Chionoecetes opilio]